MSIEKGNPEKREHNRQEEPKLVYSETKNLLDDLAQKISAEYGIDISQVKEFLKSKTWTKLSTLKDLINIHTGKTIDATELQNVLKGARSVIEKASRDEIEVLKGSIKEVKLSPETDFYLSSQFVSPDQIQRFYNPQNIWDNILWAAVWILNSAEETVKLLYNIGAWIVKTPYHIYLIASGQAEYDGFKKI